MTDVPDALRTALATRLAGMPEDGLRAAVDRLVAAYRSGRTPDGPIMGHRTDVAAYAAYRMPATYAAVRAALSRVRITPRTLLDIGGGTGAAAWAAVTAFTSLTSIVVVDQVAEALAFGADLALAAPAPALRTARWRPVALPSGLADLTSGPSAPVAGRADLATVSYVLGELSAADAGTLVDGAAAVARTVALIEPGTPAGYARIIAARTRLIERGWRVLAPCPHQQPCPIVPGRDWCHFAARVNRSALHRRIKDADLSYEDEKFSYVIATDPAEVSGSGDEYRAGGGRVLRRPTQRKGMVQLRLCRTDGTLADRIVARSHGADYRVARDLTWGDPF